MPIFSEDVADFLMQIIKCCNKISSFYWGFGWFGSKADVLAKIFCPGVCTFYKAFRIALLLESLLKDFSLDLKFCIFCAIFPYSAELAKRAIFLPLLMVSTWEVQVAIRIYLFEISWGQDFIILLWDQEVQKLNLHWVEIGRECDAPIIRVLIFGNIRSLLFTPWP